MSRDDEFGIIQVENIWEISYNSPGVLDVWLLIYEYIKIFIKISYWANISIKKFASAAYQNKFLIA